VATVSSEAIPGLGSGLSTLVVADGTAAAPYAQALLRVDTPLRDVADAVHALCMIHGGVPGVVDHAMAGATDECVRGWLARAVDLVSGERALLARLTSAVGPLPSTPGQAASEAAILGQRNALEMLARSDRRGCPAGTALAFVLDWGVVRRFLDVTAARLSVPVDRAFVGFVGETYSMLDGFSAPPAVERAMMFGAQQTLAQHRGLWNLLEARASARASM
jgi:hypothetical protein